MASTAENKIQLFEIEKFSIAQLPELQGKKEEIKTIIDANPIVEIIDKETYEQAKKSRTAVRTLRTGIEREQNDVKKKIKDTILDAVDTEYDTLVSGIKIEETLRQDAVTAYEEKKKNERKEKARVEQQRIDNIKKELDDYATEWKTAFNLMDFSSIEKVSADFLESYTTFDTTILHEFESLFPTKVEELTKYLSEKTVLLTNAENSRLENIRLEEEAAELRAEKARLESLARIAEAAEAKAKKEREDFEKEKAEFAEKQAIAAQKETFENRKKILLDLGFQFDDNIWEERDFGTTLDNVNKMDNESFSNLLEYAKDVALSIKTPSAEKVEIPEILVTVSPEMHKGVDTEEQALLLIQNIDSSAPEIPTVNVYCPLTPDECIPPATTWDSIIEEFKKSGEKSYSKWLKDNYNPPTKIQ